MNESHTPGCSALLEAVHRYAWGDLSGSQAAAVEEHLAQCECCRDTVSFMREFGRELSGQIFDSDKNKEPCPTTQLLANVEADLADEKEAHHVRAHVAHCRDCSKKFLMLRGLRNMEQSVSDTEESLETGNQRSWWTQCYEKALGVLIDIGKQVDPGSLIGTIRVTGPIPELALRGGSAQSRTSFMFEVPVGGNVYGIDLTLRKNELVFEIAGYKWTDKFSATINVYRDTGTVLGSTKTDTYGNAQLTLQYNWQPEERIILAIVLSEDVWESFSIALNNQNEQ
jgi:hypothetical protein